MSRLRSNLQSGTTTSSLNTVGTTLDSAELATLPVVTSPSYLAITLDPGEATEEIVHVTSHGASDTSAVIVRAQEGTSASSHTNGSAWVHAPTAWDFLAHPPQVRPWTTNYDFFETDTQSGWVTAAGGSASASITRQFDGVLEASCGGGVLGGTTLEISGVMKAISGTLPSSYTLRGGVSAGVGHLDSSYDDAWGILFADGLTGSDNIFGAGFRNDAGVGRLYRCTGTWAAMDIQAASFDTIGDTSAPLHFEVRKSGSNMFSLASQIGRATYNQYLGGTTAITPTHFGFWGSDFGGSSGGTDVLGMYIYMVNSLP